MHHFYFKKYERTFRLRYLSFSVQYLLWVCQRITNSIPMYSSFFLHLLVSRPMLIFGLQSHILPPFKCDVFFVGPPPFCPYRPIFICIWKDSNLTDEKYRKDSHTECLFSTWMAILYIIRKKASKGKTLPCEDLNSLTLDK